MKLVVSLIVCAFACLQIMEAQNGLRASSVDLRVITRPPSEGMAAGEWQRYVSRLSPPSIDGLPLGRVDQGGSAGRSGGVVLAQIVGGASVARGQVPWQALVIQDGIYYCGGSLLSGQWLLTAAHCTVGRKNFVVMLGAQDRTVFENGRVTLETSWQLVHPNYSSASLQNDVALLKLPFLLPTPMNYINTVRLPKVSDASKTFIGTSGTVSGWGITVNGGSVSAVLKSVVVPVVPNLNCTNTFGPAYVVASTLCVSGAAGKTTCGGDSGGPFTYREANGLWTQIGVVSFGSAGTCTNGAPVGMARVTSFLAWISAATGIAIRP